MMIWNWDLPLNDSSDIYMRGLNIMTRSNRLSGILVAGLLLLVCNQSYSQTITIGGDIYGGGREGAVGTAKAKSAAIVKEDVTLNDGALNDYSTNITINAGTVRTVFGGGQNGRTYGNTNVTIQGDNTVIGSTDWQGSIYGGVFGAGDGASAYVFGHSHLNINGGTMIQNVYGGGNQADLMGSTTVVLKGGTLNESLFGGARLANIYGYSFVHIDGNEALNNLIVKSVYGGNDIAGDISSSTKWSWTQNLELPSALVYANTDATTQNLFKSHNAFVFASPENAGKNIFVGQVFGGGNGDYSYTGNGNKLDMSSLWEERTGTQGSYQYTYKTFTVDKKPEVENVYLELNGGTYGYVYGGGNAATVTGQVDICLNDQTTPQNIYAVNLQDLEAMGLDYDTDDTESYTVANGTLKSKYQFDRVFGGNNKAAMDIQPSWHITKAIINNLYSGGNAGDMTFYRGLLLSLTSPDLEVNNVYGGCRRADVIPDIARAGLVQIPIMSGSVDGVGYSFPADLSAHILITAGKINNVYGGNDISGKVDGGNGLDIRSSILGDVYGGGNGSYAYTDNPNLSTHRIYKDFYYEIPQGKSSAQALNDFRPNAEQAWISVSGTSEQDPTVIGGSLYLGGNSATLDIDPSEADTKFAKLNIGSYVIAKNVFLGSNGENMIDPEMMALYHDGDVDGEEFSSITMTNANFAEYIKGVSIGIRPKISFDDNYVDNSAKIGSLFFGGNLGSVTAGGTFDVDFDKPLMIFEKLVAGCNDANYINQSYGINYTGGITTAPEQGDPKIRMTLNRITLKPGKLENNDVVWNTTGDGDAKRLVGGNIFGGCYNSGIINGDVVINLTSAAYDDAITFGDGNSGVTRDAQLGDVFSSALSIFGGGKGANASIQGNTNINISGTGRMLKVFGGGLEGPVNGNTAINLTGGNVGKIYGGGFEGRVNGHTSVYLDGGTVHSAFAGSCNANILEYAQIFVGSKNGAITTVQNSVYGGNDFGGTIEGTGDFSGTGYVSQTESGKVYNANSVQVLQASSYVEYVQGVIAKSIFGGSCGAYDYSNNSSYYSHIVNTSDPLPHLASSFVHFKGNNNSQNTVKQVFGAGEGKEGSTASANIQDKMQQRSYVLVNSTADSTFKYTDIFGAGAFSGLGMQIAQSNRNESDLDNHSAIVDLMGGWIHDAYGASYNEGVTRRTVVNVPAGSTARMADLFGGGYGSKLTSPCDVYESHVNWNSGTASCGYLYGGNNNSRRVLYTFVNINEQAWSNKNSGYLTTVYGAGCGPNTWAEYTNVKLNDKALVYEVYGGGYGGKVLNLESVNAWKAQDNTLYTEIGSGYTDLGFDDPLVAVNGLGTKTNTNVFINKGAVLGLRSDRRSEGIYPVTIAGGYGYAGGYGDNNLKDGFDESIGSVSGTTYIGLHGGIAWKDIYAGGTLGSVYDAFGLKTFTAQSNAYIEGGAARNVYGAGWKGRIGYTELPVTVDLNNTDPYEVLKNDIPGESNVVIGIAPEEKENVIAAGYEWGFFKGEPTIERNAYSSGEDGGAVIGTAHMTVSGGYVGYRYAAVDNTSNIVDHYFSPTTDNKTYLEKTFDETWAYDTEHPSQADGTDRLLDAGSVFGGGYTDNATADNTIVTVWGGHIRNSVYGGGEVAAIGRGEALETTGSAIRQLKGIYKSGSTQVNIYSGNIDRNVFGGGKGYNNNGTKGNLLTDGYVFGTTEVNIYGGEIGTDLTVLEGDGNVFGGGNIGYVYNSLNSKKFDGQGGDGYYYQIDENGDWVTHNNEKLLSEDCKVVVKPYSRVLTTNGVDVDGVHYNQFDFVPTEKLNKIHKEDNRWFKVKDGAESGSLDQTGIIIHNAIFAGGNVSSGNELYANTKTVFGNATASVVDLYYCDLITVGTEHIGGLYGDGNLTRVDGYRELNITNYGTDYYGMNTDRVTLADYHKMNDRERAYFQLKYVSKQAFTYSGTAYSIGTIFTKDEIKEKFPNGTTIGNLVIVDANGTPNSDVWDEYGFVSIYAGRLINTIQRADFVGVFGSRMVMQGARDRVPETVDFTNYTINRVGEVSLNRVTDPNNEEDDKTHKIKRNGNYFGIYNIVNHLAALTSDIDFTEERVTDKSTDDELYHPKTEAEKSFYGWKYANKLNRRRNDGEADNKVALASGVYLEITTEESTQDNKVWGPITGILELDLINVMPGMGGGYVYAKNVHGVRSNTTLQHITLSPYNQNAVSNKKYEYSVPAVDDDFQTSGNLVSSKTIIDDCYPTSDSYSGNDAAAGHYWYIKGEIYVYDLYLSAYTGAAAAYSKTVSIPLTITAGSHGVIKLQDVKANKYMYYGTDNQTRLGADESVIINNITYALNDSISYWDWLQLSESDQVKFVDKTYVTITDCKVGETLYSKGYALNETDYQSFYNSLGDDKTVYHVAKKVDVPVTDVFRPSNDMSHDKGYALTLDINNPEAWNAYYMPKSGSDKTTTPSSNLLNSPTYKVNTTGIYGQREYGRGDIITDDVYQTYQSLVTSHPTLVPSAEVAAVFEPAYVMTEDWSYEKDGAIRYFNKGLVMPQSEWSTNVIGAKAGLAYFCTETWKLEADNMLDEYIFYGTSMTEQEIRDFAAPYYTEQQINEAISKYFSRAYYCTKKGKYGGDYYEQDHNYVAKTAWSGMNPEDRQYFNFNYDAFDVLIDSTFSGNPLLYDGVNQTVPGTYSSPQPMDYTAKCMKDEGATYIDVNQASHTVAKNTVLSRAEYEALPNEQYHYAPFVISAENPTAYIVQSLFTLGNKTYTIGNSISAATYTSLSDDNRQKIKVFSNLSPGKYYYCRDSYPIGINGSESGKNSEIENIINNQTITTGTVEAGVVIREADYNDLPNVQKYFSIHGKTPVGTSTLYVSGQSNILDLSKGRIYTVTYNYDYEESDDEGNNINQVSEKHIINIHVQFQGGTPTISPIGNPPTVLPGSTIGMNQPRVTPGAYEVIGGGWELYQSYDDAVKHVNGAEYDNGRTVLYWYNNNYYLAYYAKTYLGKTYSNEVPIKVGNYHDLSRVMRDKEHHMYVDHPNVKRNSKIYISGNKYDTTDPQATPTKNELDMLKDFYDLSLYQYTVDENNDPVAISDGSTFNGHIPMNDHVKGGANIDFIIKTDAEPLAYTDWTPIGSNTQCFEGTLHGDGHTISGLNNSLFSYLCGTVYNLGVTGSFDGTSSGIADNGGKAVNTWINTTGTITANTKAVMGTGIAQNSYYPQEITGYVAPAGVTARPMTAFRNGEVAYALNGFYLTKRDEIKNNTGNKYFYTITDPANNILSALPADYVEPTDYVAQRYLNGDFIYSSGVIPDQTSERLFFKEPTNEEISDPKNNKYFPIYPDDYIFFGQMLTYGYSNIRGEEYQEYPSSINRDNRNAAGTQHHATQWIPREEVNSSNSIKSNRVYRAPAYFGNSTMSVAYFNANAVLPDHTNNQAQNPVYPGLTALDLTGYNDNTGLLDFNALTGFRSDGQTRNLLAYTMYGNATTTNGVLTTYFADQGFQFGGGAYKTVAQLAQDLESRVKGHLVNKNGGVYEAASDQYLVDRQDFNAPIKYTLGDGTYMWYQRTPDRYVESTDAGWEAISLPFTAQYVTTQAKGELTHFYSGSNTGHEYWLREYQSIDNTDNSAIKAMFSAPAPASGFNKAYGNTFLWDYYYKKNSGNDANQDKYFQTYYSQGQTYNNYPMYAAGTPYLIGFPGNRYYEFDLSGQFLAQNTAGQPLKLDAQVITFISPDAGTTIGVTDQDYANKSVTADGYVYKPNYKTETVTAYMLNNTGDSFVYTQDVQTVPFRAYLASAPSPAQRRAGTRADAVFIGYLGDSDPLIETPVQRGLNIYGEHLTITVENTMDEPAQVTITSAAGKLLKQFTVQPGTKATVPVNSRGIYIVNRQKIAVTR